MLRVALVVLASSIAIACAPTPASPVVASSDAGSVQSAPIPTADASAPASEPATEPARDAEAAPAVAAAVVDADAGEKTAGIIAPQKAGPRSFDEALSSPGHKSASPAASPNSEVPFDRGAAAHAIQTVKLDTCKVKDGPTGKGHILITFAPDGRPTSTKIEDPPFAGTAAGKCVETKFREVRVPKFSGAPVPVRAPFIIKE